ncbi:BLUF domain-containing protein [Stakelama sp. CBK3Z-3]|uniref:BLUF domain-containing protein n=1 Tax=Stakelama flava TaxID=2860338 RepID=A0ABS6XJL9_9SPHN|nr:BLUF domain-containing protein [Stakelama flava]MBW4329596.1 BLUF domain-containing protein [Stakelama flava]
MLQFIYISTATAPVTRSMVERILARSRQNNERDALTGLLYSDGKRFMQVLEGEASVVERTVARIGKDSRHRGIVRLSERMIETREFGDWAMAHHSHGEDAKAFVEEVGRRVANASPAVRGTFEGLAAHRSAA